MYINFFSDLVESNFLFFIFIYIETVSFSSCSCRDTQGFRDGILAFLANMAEGQQKEKLVFTKKPDS